MEIYQPSCDVLAYSALNKLRSLAMIQFCQLPLVDEVGSHAQLLDGINYQHNTSIGQAVIGVGVPLFFDDLAKANLLDGGKAVGAVGGEVDGEGQFRNFSHGFLLPFFVSYK